MTIKEVKLEIKRIRHTTDDDERAHILEDELYLGVLSSIAKGTAEDPAEMARLCCTTQLIDFHRWCA